MAKLPGATQERRSDLELQLPLASSRTIIAKSELVEVFWETTVELAGIGDSISWQGSCRTSLKIVTMVISILVPVILEQLALLNIALADDIGGTESGPAS